MTPQEILANETADDDVNVILDRIQLRLGIAVENRFLSQVAILLGVRFETLFRYRNGTRIPSQQALQGLRILELLLDADPPKAVLEKRHQRRSLPNLASAS